MLVKDLVFYLAIGVIVSILIFCIGLFLSGRKKEKKILFYGENYRKVFWKTKDIRQTMTELTTLYKKNSKEAQALKAGLFYLDRSLIKDYSTALSYIEEVMDDDRIDKLHKDSIDMIRKTKILSLPKK